MVHRSVVAGRSLVSGTLAAGSSVGSSMVGNALIVGGTLLSCHEVLHLVLVVILQLQRRS